MRIIQKSQLSTESPKGLQISDAARNSLLRCYVRREPAHSDIDEVQSLLQSARADEAWLECDCKPPLSSFLFPRKLQSGMYTLARPQHQSEYSHSPECPFHHADFTIKLNNAYPELNVYRDKRDQSQIHPRLCSILRWLLQLNRLYTYPTQDKYNYVQYLIETHEKLDEFPAITEHLAPTDIIWTNSKYIVPFYKSLQKLTFPDNMQPQGFVFCLISEVEENTIVLASGLELTVKQSIQCPMKSSGPYWGLLLVTEKQHKFFDVHTATLLPAYSLKQPFVLCDDAERAMYKQMISVALSDESEGKTTITKRQDNGKLADGFIVNHNDNQVTVYPASVNGEDPSDPEALFYDRFSSDRIFRQHLFARLYR